MAFEITELIRDPANRVFIHAYDVDSGTLEAGEGIRVQIGVPGNPETIFTAQVPVGTIWKNIVFQFQATEESV
jgi:hypothetical protein